MSDCLFLCFQTDSGSVRGWCFPGGSATKQGNRSCFNQLNIGCCHGNQSTVVITLWLVDNSQMFQQRLLSVNVLTIITFTCFFWKHLCLRPIRWWGCVDKWWRRGKRTTQPIRCSWVAWLSSSWTTRRTQSSWWEAPWGGSCSL